MKLKWKQFFLPFAMLTVALAGCSSDSSPQQAVSASSAFKKHIGYLQNVEFRQALRNSWVGTSETSGLWAMPQDEQLDGTFDRGVPPELLDAGKQIGGNLIKKGLSYAIDKAFGIQTKAQKERDETNFINRSLVGIQHQLTEIQANLGTVYNNQITAMESEGQSQIGTITDFASTEETIINQSSDAQTFTNNYTTFIDDLQNNTNGESEGWTLNFNNLCDTTTDFLSNNYGNLEEGNRQNTILVYAFNMVNDLFGTPISSDSSQWPQWVTSLNTDATQYMTALINDVTGFNIVSNYYAAGTQVTQAGYGMGDLLQKTYTVFAFTLQFAANCPRVQTFYSGADAAPGNIYNYSKDGTTIPNLLATVTTANLSTYLGYLNYNFNTQFYNNAVTYFDKIAAPFLTYGGTTSQYWDTASLISAAGLSLEKGFMSNGCFPLNYVKNLDKNGNLDYLAAECNYNNNWTALQLFIPTNNGTPGITDISYLSSFGLIGDIDYNEIKGRMGQTNQISSAGSCGQESSSHYDNQCTTGFDDCYVGHTSMQLQPTPVPSYGSAFIGATGSSWGTPGLDQRFTFYSNVCYGGGSSPCTNDFYTVVFTPNGHLFQTDLHGQFCENSTAHDMKNTQVDLSAGGITEATQYSNGTLSFTDGSQVTNITFGGPSNNPAGQNGNADPNWAEYGFGVNVQSAPQPSATSYPVCSNGATISLGGFYSYSESDPSTGTVTDDVTIDVNGKTGTFSSDYTTFTFNNTTWQRETANSESIGQDAMQGLWSSGTGSNTVYMTTNCGNPN